MNGYDLSRNWFNFCFENPEKISPNHTAIFFFAVEHCNRMGWKKKFGFPTTMAKDAIGIKSYNTYIKCFNELVEWGFIELIQKSENQYSSNIIALSNFDKSLDKSLDKAMINHLINQSEITVQTNDSIDKPQTLEQDNIKPNNDDVPFFASSPEKTENIISDMYDAWMLNNPGYPQQKSTDFTALAEILGKFKEIGKIEKDPFTDPGAAKIIKDGWLALIPSICVHTFYSTKSLKIISGGIQNIIIEYQKKPAKQIATSKLEQNLSELEIAINANNKDHARQQAN